MKHRGSFPHRMDAPERQQIETNGRRDASLRPSVRLLDGV